MISVFRKLRQQAQGKAARYGLYAFGEIVLVVPGILIALQINNNNDLRKERKSELLYLASLRKDLVLNIAEINKYLQDRTVCITNATAILEHFEGKPITDAVAFNNLCMPIYNWQRYYQVDNTFQELISSGNLALIGSDSIKTMLFNLQSMYKLNKAEEDHFRFDSEVLIHEPIYEFLDLKSVVESVGVEITKGYAGRPMQPRDFDGYLRNIKLKNGFTSAVFEFTVLNEHLLKMKVMSEALIRTIDNEIARG